MILNKKAFLLALDRQKFLTGMVPASLGKGDEGLVSDQFTLALAGSQFLHMRESGPSSDLSMFYPSAFL